MDQTGSNSFWICLIFSTRRRTRQQRGNAFSLFVIRATPAQATGAFANHALGLYLSEGIASAERWSGGQSRAGAIREP